MKKYDHLSDEEQLEIIRDQPHILRFIRDPSERVISESVRMHPKSINYIINIPSKIQLEIIEQCNEPYILNIFLREFWYKFTDKNALETLKNKIAVLEVMGS